MNIFDQILASGYFALNGKLNSHMVRRFVSVARASGKKFKREELMMNEMSEYMYFANQHYMLKDGCTMDDIALYIDWNIVIVFHNLLRVRDIYFTNKARLEEPNFENAMSKVQNDNLNLQKDMIKVKRI